jgi:hypothetical protein
MRNLLIALSCSIVLLTSCGSRIHCTDPSLTFGTKEQLAYKLDKYVKGSNFSQLITSDSAVAIPYQTDGRNTYHMNSDFDWIITVQETGKTYKIEKIRYETYKAYSRFGDSHGSPTNCSNIIFYTLNGTEGKVDGESWRYGSHNAKVCIYINK